MERLKKDIYNFRFAIIPVIIYFLIMQIKFGTICPLKAFTGIPCPGCGLTHASIYLFIGQIKKSLEANPTAILWIIAIIAFFIDRYIKKIKVKIFPTFFTIIGVITIAVYILKYFILR